MTRSPIAHIDETRKHADEAREADSRSPIQAISRAARILGLFSPERPALSLPEMTRLFGMGKATTHRYAMSLRQCGLLNYDAATARYTLGIRLVGMAKVAQASLHVVEIAGPYLFNLADKLNETTALTVWDGEAPIVVRVAEAPRRTVYRAMRIGAKLRQGGAHHAVYRAFFEDGIKTLEMARVRKDGIAIRNGIDDDLRVAACPVFEGDEVAACIAIHGSRRRITMDIDSPTARLLRRAAAGISAELGGSARNRTEASPASPRG